MKEIIGDIRDTKKLSNIVVAHVCNDVGAWGAGVSGVIGKMYPDAEHYYGLWHSTKHANFDHAIRDIKTFALGQTQFISVDKSRTIFVANMIAQHKLISTKNKMPLKMNALQICLMQLFGFAKERELTVHMPRIGSGLAGGNWNEISVLVDNIADSHGVSVTVYALEK